jgi:heme exporter protein D
MCKNDNVIHTNSNQEEMHMGSYARFGWMILCSTLAPMAVVRKLEIAEMEALIDDIERNGPQR